MHNARALSNQKFGTSDAFLVVRAVAEENWTEMLNTSRLGSSQLQRQDLALA